MAIFIGCIALLFLLFPFIIEIAIVAFWLWLLYCVIQAIGWLAS